MTPSGTGTCRIAAVVLAAGGSARMGQVKQLLPVRGQPMVRRVAEAVCAAGLAQVVVVVGAQAAAIASVLDGLPAEFVLNDRWADGLSTSLRVGLQALRADIHAALIVLADQPALSARLLHALVARYERTHALIVAPFYGERRGNPVLWDRALFPALMAVQGDRGGRDLLTLHGAKVEHLAVDDPAVIQDLDTAQDYEGAQAAEGVR